MHPDKVSKCTKEGKQIGKVNADCVLDGLRELLLLLLTVLMALQSEHSYFVETSIQK